MAVTANDIKGYKAATMGATLTSPSPIGGGISANEFTGASIGELLFKMTSSGSAQTQYEPFHIKNTHATDSLQSAVVYLKNALSALGSNGTASVVSSSSSDNNSLKVKLIGLDASSNWQTEEITLNGTTTVNGTATWSVIERAELRNVSSNALTNATGDITISRGSTIGIIPSGYQSATAEIEIGLEGSLNTSTTTTNAGTAPTGITFSRPRTAATGISIANAGTLPAGSNQQGWLKWTLRAGALPSSDIQSLITVNGGAV